MSFSPFNNQDFRLMEQINGSPIPQLEQKINYLREELCNFPEYDLDFFGNVLFADQICEVVVDLFLVHRDGLKSTGIYISLGEIKIKFN